MASYASAVIAEARGWKDYQEKKSMGSRAQLEQKHWNPGYNNYTIFWEWYKDYTGASYQGQAWCAGFVSCMFVKAFGLDKAKQLLGGSLYINCQDFVSRHSSDKRMNYSAKVGDPVFFHNGTKWCHTGIVTGVYNSYITSIEGNTSGSYDKVVPDGGAVVEKSHYFNTTKMIFWHPDFDADPGTPTVSQEYSIWVGTDGLVVSQDLNIRMSPANGDIVGTYKRGDHIYPTTKVFVYTNKSSTPWYKTDKGWISAKYISGGWVQEESKRWWWIKTGYRCDTNTTFVVDQETYYADNTGYIVQSQWVDIDNNFYYFDYNGAMATYCYVKSTTSDLYYWVNEDGVWEEQWNTTTPNLNKYKVVF